MKLHIDIETYGSVDLKTSGVYKYVESPDFEILLIAYALDDGPINIIDLAIGEGLHWEFVEAISDPAIEKHAHNATFERIAFKAAGFDIPAEEWYCSAIKASYCGWPISLEMISKAMDLGSHGKATTGRALIKYFCAPCKSSKVNGSRSRNFPEHDEDKWEEFKDYCKQDVEAERTIVTALEGYIMPTSERQNYLLDQQINDLGIEIDQDFAHTALKMDAIYSKGIIQELKEITGVANPGSAAQLKAWLSLAMKKEIKSLAKDSVEALLLEAGTDAAQVLKLRKKGSKTSIKKYIAMENCVCNDGRAHGLFQFYGAGRTGRWAGRLIQMQNLPQNHLADIGLDRQVIRSGDYDLATLLYDDISSILSQLIRTAFVAKEGHTFVVADFSAIEARVVGWLAGEKWRMDVFNSHGKIYEASASMMFSVPIESVTKGSDLRNKGKVAELALGYGGAVGALTQMGGEKMGLTDSEMDGIVKKWRRANPAIVNFWHAVENAAKRAIETRKIVVYKNLIFSCDSNALMIQLPSGRKLFYQEPGFKLNRFGQPGIKYKGMDQVTKQWGWIETYGGKLTENIVQAVARDLLAEAMAGADAAGFNIVMHVHDEMVCEVPEKMAKEDLERLCSEMQLKSLDWATGLPLTADGYITKFYKKD